MGMDKTMEIVSVVFDYIISKIRQNNFKTKSSVERLIREDERREEKWQEFYLNVAKLCKTEWDINEKKIDLVVKDLQEKRNELLDAIRNNEEIDSLCDAWLYCCIYESQLIGNESQIREKYEAYMADNSVSIQQKEKLMIGDIVANSRYGADEKIIKKYLNQYQQELYEIVIDLEMSHITDFLHERLRPYQYIVNRIMKSYNAENKR